MENRSSYSPECVFVLKLTRDPGAFCWELWELAFRWDADGPAEASSLGGTCTANLWGGGLQIVSLILAD